jgi:hypothetical protein
MVLHLLISVSMAEVISERWLAMRSAIDDRHNRITRLKSYRSTDRADAGNGRAVYEGRSMLLIGRCELPEIIIRDTLCSKGPGVAGQKTLAIGSSLSRMT